MSDSTKEGKAFNAKTIKYLKAGIDQYGPKPDPSSATHKRSMDLLADVLSTLMPQYVRGLQPIRYDPKKTTFAAAALPNTVPVIIDIDQPNISDARLINFKPPVRSRATRACTC